MKNNIVTLIILFIYCLTAHSQNPANINDNFPDFALKSLDGKEISNEQLKGKNTLVVFLRGKVGNHWCNLCHYQYAELAKYEQENQLREKLNMEIIFVLPYTADEVQHWVDIFPAQLDEIQTWKYPEEGKKKKWMEKIPQIAPYDIVYTNGDVPLPFPILVDENQELSKELGLYTMFWSKSYVEQNIPCVFALDTSGKVVFKYLSQNTMDRIPVQHLDKLLSALLVN